MGGPFNEIGLANNEAGRSPGDYRFLEIVDAELEERDGVRGTLVRLDTLAAVLRILGGDFDMMRTRLLVRLVD